MTTGTRRLWFIIGLSIAATSLSARAATVSSFFVIGANQASDEDRLYLIDRNSKAAPIGQIDIGDSLRGHLSFNTLNDSSANLGGATGNNEWTALFQIRVVDKLAVDDGLGGMNFIYSFAPDTEFEDVWGIGAMIVAWEDASLDFAADLDDPTAPVAVDDGGPLTDLSVGPYASEEAFIATATNGTRFWTLGFTDDTTGEGSSTAGTGQGWFGTHLGSDLISAAFAIPSGSLFGTHNWGIDRIANGIIETGDAVLLGDTVGPLGLNAHFIGSTELRGISNLDTAFEASSNTNVSFTIIPEPTTLALLTLGALSAAFGRRRSAR